MIKEQFLKKNLSIFILRVAIGALFLWSGIEKVFSSFSAEGYLLNATSGPFQDQFVSLAGSQAVDLLVTYGEVGIGLSLLFGVFLRFGALSGSIMMMLFYFSTFPPEHGLISNHIIYTLVFVILGIHGAGRWYGVDGLLEQHSFIKRRYKIFRFFLG